MPNPPTHAGKLTKAQRDHLEWMDKEDFSPYGSCKGRVFDELLDLGFVQVHGKPDARGIEYNQASVTDAGRAALQSNSGADE